METPSKGIRIWTYRFQFHLPNGGVGKLIAETGFKGIRSCLLVDDEVHASDYTPFSMAMTEEVTRNHRLEADIAGEGSLCVQLGYVTSLKMGVRVFLVNDLIHESHPGRTLDALIKQAEKTHEQLKSNPKAKEEWGKFASQKDKFKRNWPSLAVDIALGFIFFFLAKWTDLTTAALWGAAAGLALVVVQQFVKTVDILGGLALFGIVMMLISAGYALIFQDEYLIQMRTTAMGGLGATLYLVDGALGGRYLGERTARYMFMPDIAPQRLSLAFGSISILMAVLNWGVVKMVSKDIWLYYTTFGDFIIVVALFSIAIKWVVVPGYDKRRRVVTDAADLS